MNLKQSQEYKLYSTSKTNIQMVEAELEELHTKVNYQLSEECITEIQFGTRIEVINEVKSIGYLKTLVKVSNKGEKDPGVILEVVYKGEFKAYDNLNKFQIETWVEVQLVPQLLPYTRVLISNITSLMGINSITLPTIDILETMRMNDPNKSQAGVEESE